MKLIFMLSMVLLSIEAHAEIFVCRDAQNKTIYQDKPCALETVRTLEPIPAPSIEEQILAQERIDKLNEISSQRAMAAETERLQQEKNNLEQEKIELEKRKLELVEKQATLDEQPVTRYIYVNPNLRPRVQRLHQHRDWHHQKRQNPQTPVMQTPVMKDKSIPTSP